MRQTGFLAEDENSRGLEQPPVGALVHPPVDMEPSRHLLRVAAGLESLGFGIYLICNAALVQSLPGGKDMPQTPALRSVGMSPAKNVTAAGKVGGM
jgi:hypothetical protein